MERRNLTSKEVPGSDATPKPLKKGSQNRAKITPNQFKSIRKAKQNDDPFFGTCCQWFCMILDVFLEAKIHPNSFLKLTKCKIEKPYQTVPLCIEIEGQAFQNQSTNYQKSIPNQVMKKHNGKYKNNQHFICFDLPKRRFVYLIRNKKRYEI